MSLLTMPGRILRRIRLTSYQFSWIGCLFEKDVRKRFWCSDAANVNDTQFRKKPQLGARFLTDRRRVYDFNAWYIVYFSTYIVE